MKNLNEILKYNNSELKLRIKKRFKVSDEVCEKIYVETLAWLWLCAKHREQVNSDEAFSERLPFLRMLEHFKNIDYAWHEFILMTKDYHHFCSTFLNGYIHHTPAKVCPDTLNRIADVAADDHYYNIYFEFIYDQLGPDRLRYWLDEIPKVKTA